jgi:hypothetical protein
VKQRKTCFGVRMPVDARSSDLPVPPFAGLLWHSHSVNNGFVSVNYYIKEMYGDPSLIQNVWKSPLAQLTLYGTPDMFNHPVMNKLLQIKWHRFAKMFFILIQVSSNRTHGLGFISTRMLFSFYMLARADSGYQGMG